MHLLWQNHGEATLGGNLELQIVQEDGCGWSVDCIVCSTEGDSVGIVSYVVWDLQNAGRGSYEINDSTVKRNCGGLRDVWGRLWSIAALEKSMEDVVAVGGDRTSD